MTGNKYSWYTIIHPDYEGWPAPPIYRLVGPAIEQSGEATCDTYYKENRKGGHRYNHIYNKLHKHIFRGRNARKCVSRKDKPEFVKTCYLNLKLGNVAWDSLLHTIFYHNKQVKKDV